MSSYARAIGKRKVRKVRKVQMLGFFAGVYLFLMFAPFVQQFTSTENLLWVALAFNGILFCVLFFFIC